MSFTVALLLLLSSNSVIGVYSAVHMDHVRLVN